MTDAANRVAVYIDFDNIVISRYEQVHARKGVFGKEGVRDQTARTNDKLAAAHLDLDAILDYASSFGVIAIKQAYADWSAAVNAQYRPELVSRAIELTQLFTTTQGMKNGADIRLSLDVIEDLHRLPDITHVVLVAGDSDYISLAQRVKRLGRTVIGIGVAGSISRALVAAVDDFAEYSALPGVLKKEVEPEEAKRPEPRTDDVAQPITPKEATALLRRALQLIDETDDDEWLYQSQVKSLMRRLDSRFNEKSLGYTSFTKFLESRHNVVEIRKDTDANERRLRLRETPPSK